MTTVREKVNRMLFGGQHDGIIQWIENLERELMPEIRYYTVTQEREVKVSANTPVEAAQIAQRAFDNNTYALPEGEEGSVFTKVRDRDLVVREEY